MNLEKIYSKKAWETDSPLEKENYDFITLKARFYKEDMGKILPSLQGAADGWSKAMPKSDALYSRLQFRAWHMQKEIESMKRMMAKECLIAREYAMQMKSWNTSLIGKAIYPTGEEYVTPNHVFRVLIDVGNITLDDVVRWFKEHHPECLEKN